MENFQSDVTLWAFIGIGVFVLACIGLVWCAWQEIDEYLDSHGDGRED